MPKLYRTAMAALAGLVATSAQADWVPVAESGSGAVFSIDSDRIRVV